MIDEAREFAHDDAQILGTLGHGEAGELFHREAVGPVVGHRAEVVEAVGVGQRAPVGGGLGDLLVIAVKVTEDGLEADDALAFELHVHAEDAVGGRMMRPHRDLEHFAAKAVAARGEGDAGAQDRKSVV